MYTNDGIIKTQVLSKLLDFLGPKLYSYELIIDSRKVKPNSIFFAYKGSVTDGREYIKEAKANGANIILWDDNDSFKFDLDIINYPIKNLAYYIGIIAAIKENIPSKKLKIIGVTGTNGKTSITYWLNQAYFLLSLKPAIIGTTGYGIYPQINEYDRTTPDPIFLQKILANFVEHNCNIAAMEVSSHALDQGRVNGVIFDSVIWTNLTLEHLDYHKTMDNYYMAKRKLFFWQEHAKTIINTDDLYGKKLFEEILSKQSSKTNKLISYGINSGDIRADNILFTLTGMKFNIIFKKQSVAIDAQVIGNFNVYNILAVCANLILDGYLLDDIQKIIPQLVPVKGRMETIVMENKPLTVIDYSHKPDALYNVLKTLKEIEAGQKIYCVVGCGGNRDKTKRPIMGDIATTIADYVIFTSDNPRFEDPYSILDQIVSGVKTNNYKVMENRKNAIAEAINLASPKDIVLIAGKGHETYQEIQGNKTHFSDIEVARAFLMDK